jgi:hypothetical protein
MAERVEVIKRVAAESSVNPQLLLAFSNSVPLGAWSAC